MAARHRLPTIYPFRFFAEHGGLLSYGNDVLDNFRRAANYADRILRGAKPSELPVQAPVKFELVINMKTAKALGPRGARAAPADRRRGDRIGHFLVGVASGMTRRAGCVVSSRGRWFLPASAALRFAPNGGKHQRF